MKIFIPIGVDCSVATILNEFEARKQSLPFDWLVSYKNGETIISHFKDFFNSPQNLFLHHNIETDKDIFLRRIDRLYEMIDGDNELVFIRKSHSEHHHYENYHISIQEEIEDLKRLDNFLSSKNTKFKILYFMTCDVCKYSQYSSNNFDFIDIIKIYGKGNTTNKVGNNNAYSDKVKLYFREHFINNPLSDEDQEFLRMINIK